MVHVNQGGIRMKAQYRIYEIAGEILGSSDSELNKKMIEIRKLVFEISVEDLE